MSAPKIKSWTMIRMIVWVIMVAHIGSAAICIVQGDAQGLLLRLTTIALCIVYLGRDRSLR